MAGRSAAAQPRLGTAGCKEASGPWRLSSEQQPAAAALGRRHRTLTRALQLWVTLDTRKTSSRKAMRTPTLKAR